MNIEVGFSAWTKLDLINVMQMLVDSELSMVDYNSVCQSIGRQIVISMIEYNLIHMWPTSSLSFDILMHRRHFITAQSPATLMAMQMILKEDVSEN